MTKGTVSASGGLVLRGRAPPGAAASRRARRPPAATQCWTLTTFMDGDAHLAGRITPDPHRRGNGPTGRRGASRLAGPAGQCRSRPSHGNRRPDALFRSAALRYRPPNFPINQRMRAVAEPRAELSHEGRNPSRLPHHQGGHDRWHRVHDPLHLGQAGRHAASRHRPKSHPAWTGGPQQLLDRGGRLSRFQKKFSGFLKK